MASEINNTLINFELIEKRGKEKFGSVTRMLRHADINSKVYYDWKNNKVDPRMGNVRKLVSMVSDNFVDAMNVGNDYPSAA